MGGVSCCTSRSLDDLPVEQQERIEAILNAWFASENFDRHTSPPSAELQRLWLDSTPMQNKCLKELFAGDLDKYSGGEYFEWERTKDGCLAIIILCDQLAPRMYKHSAKAYAYEERALALTQRLLR